MAEPTHGAVQHLRFAVEEHLAVAETALARMRLLVDELDAPELSDVKTLLEDHIGARQELVLEMQRQLDTYTKRKETRQQ